MFEITFKLIKNIRLNCDAKFFNPMFSTMSIIKSVLAQFIVMSSVLTVMDKNHEQYIPGISNLAS